MSRMLSFVTLLAVLGLIVSACGSGGESANPDDQPQATETPRSERVERQATVMQQDQATEPVADQGQDAEDADNLNRPQFGIEEDVTQAEAADDTESSAPTAEVTVSASVIDFGHREGLPFARNVVGDPEAPVLIIEYSDFQ